MAASALFSRLQLAAALLEYDNDPDNPDASYRSAQDSAIFAHLRRNPAARPEVGTRRSEYITSDTGSFGGRESALDVRRSRGSRSSMDALRNPFSGDNHSETEHNVEGDEEEEGLEVDLASWGLDAFMPKDKASKSARARGKQPAVGSTRTRYPSTSHDSLAAAPRRAVVTAKSMSVGGLMDLDVERLQDDRRRSYGTPLDLAGMEAPDIPFTHRRVTSQASLAPSQTVMVPFPSGSVRSPSPGIEHALETRSVAHGRTHSTASMNSRFLLERGEETAARHRSVSIGTLDALQPPEDNPFAIEHPSHISRFDPKSAARARSYSNVSLGSRMVLESDGASVMTGDPYARERRLSTLELLRPKVLVMPSPLQPVSTNVAPEPTRKVREGFELTTDGPPLPPGARSSRRLSSSLSVFDSGAENIPLASNSFTPNPLLDLTPSQKLFRNTLVVGGQSITNDIPRATQDGEQALLDPSSKDETPATPAAGEGLAKPSRPAGKLYGKSLIDDLENRKAQMRSKQRVFTGDQRPSMMARSQQRSSTLIDPASLQTRPSAQRMSSYGSQNAEQGLERQKSLGRRGSLNAKPLLSFDDEQDKGPQLSPNIKRLPANHSVFGVDTLWEREMAKLKEIQAQEEIEKEAQRKAEAEVERKKAGKKNKRKKKGTGREGPSEQVETLPNEESHIPVAPPMLPDIQRATRRAPPKPSDSDVSTESDDETPIHQKDPNVPAWHNSSDEEDAPRRRITGVGPRHPAQGKKATQYRADDDSEEDVPLAATIRKAVARATLSHRHLQDSDDEDRPLSQVVHVKASLSPIPPTLSKLSLNNVGSTSDNDDDQPLGLRASHIPPGLSKNGDDDDMPLAFHPDQQRRTQYQMFAQQQQQQMLMQAQMQSSMMMSASMMGPNYFAPTMMNPMAMMQPQVPMSIPSPPPMVDATKFGTVDRWRRGVAVEGENP